MKSSDEVARELLEPRFFYFAAQYRRAILWALGGAVLLMTVGQGLLILDNRFNLDKLLVACVVVVLIAISSFSLLGPRLRIDRDGISRRNWWRWDLWPWEAFAEGRIRLGNFPGEYEFPERPIFTNELHLGLLEAPEARLVEDLIRKVWRPANPVDPPESISVQLGAFGRQKLVFTPSGFEFSSNMGSTEYRWDQCTKIQICRHQHDHDRFREITIHFNDDKVTCRGDETNGSLARFICEYANPESIQHLAYSGSAKSIVEVDWRIQWINVVLIKQQRFRRWAPVACVGVAVITTSVLGWVGLLMAAVASLHVYPAMWAVRERVVEMEQMLRDLELDRTRLMSGNDPSEPELNVGALNGRCSRLSGSQRPD